MFCANSIVFSGILWCSVVKRRTPCVSIFVIIYFLFIIWTFFFWTRRDRKHYYIKVVESIQFVCAGNSGISRVLCNANTYRSFHEGLFFNSSPALDFKNIPWDSPISIFISLRFIYNIKLKASIHKYFNQSDWLLYFSCSRGECQTTRPADNSDRSKGLVEP